MARILLSCNARTLALAGKLRDELHKGDCETALWSDDATSQSSAALLDLLDRAAEQFDFAAIILVKDDVTVTEADNSRGAWDTYNFQAGLFMAKIGRERCFLVNGLGNSALTSHFGGIICIPFEEPADLNDLAACENAVVGVAAELKDRMAQQGDSRYYVRVPNLSITEVWRKERHFSEGGELQQGEVIVCETQPLPQESFAIQVRRNMDNAISYFYFLYFSVDTIEKICRSLQVILVAGVADADLASDFTSRIRVVKSQKNLVLEDFRSICHHKRLQVALMFEEPPMNFRIHNASSPELAKLYGRYRDQCFIPWSDGASAWSIWQNLGKWIEKSEQDRLIVSLKWNNEDQQNQFKNSLDLAVGRYFPGMEAEVKRLMTGIQS
jgi:Predicted nucleotide-binding protein containing TIR-like domain